MANERGRITDTDGDTIILLNDATTKIKIIREETDVQGGLNKKPLPTQRSKYSLCLSLWGRGRVVNIEGIKIGTQTQIEDFIREIENIINVAGINNQVRYYPLFCKTYSSTDGEGNTSAASNLQTGYYTVAMDAFNFTAELREVGYILRYSMTLYECAGIS